jgi:parallel beta-helix repeat protein
MRAISRAAQNATEQYTPQWSPREGSIMRTSIALGALAVLGVSFSVADVPSIEASATGTHRVLYVANNGVDSATCGPWGTPCRTISRAIENAVDGDQIEVGPGLYGDLNGDEDLDDPGEERPPQFGEAAAVVVYKRLGIYSQEGAAATTIRFSPLGSGLTRIVDITHDGVTFGRPNGGFTILGGAETFGITSEASRVRIVGNVALNNNLGFSFFRDEQTTIEKNIVVDNVAVGFSGFRANVTTINMVFDGDIAIGNQSHIQGNEGWGFLIEGSGQVVKNCRASGNGTGIVVSGDGNNTFLGNSVIGNIGPGFRFHGGSSNVLRRNNIFGNGTGFAAGILIANCGVYNHSAFVVDAAQNYWGARSGPGPDPADNAGPGSGCDVSDSPTITEPFATRPFPIH